MTADGSPRSQDNTPARICGQHPHIYDHWTCQLPRGHRGPHRFNNYTWRKGAVLWSEIRYVTRAAWLRVTFQPPWRIALKHTRSKYDPIPGAVPRDC